MIRSLEPEASGNQVNDPLVLYSDCIAAMRDSRRDIIAWIATQMEPLSVQVFLKDGTVEYAVICRDIIRILEKAKGL